MCYTYEDMFDKKNDTQNGTLASPEDPEWLKLENTALRCTLDKIKQAMDKEEYGEVDAIEQHFRDIGLAAAKYQQLHGQSDKANKSSDNNNSFSLKDNRYCKEIDVLAAKVTAMEKTVHEFGKILNELKIKFLDYIELEREVAGVSSDSYRERNTAGYGERANLSVSTGTAISSEAITAGSAITTSAITTADNTNRYGHHRRHHDKDYKKHHGVEKASDCCNKDVATSLQSYKKSSTKVHSACACAAGCDCGCCGQEKDSKGNPVSCSCLIPGSESDCDHEHEKWVRLGQDGSEKSPVSN